MKQKFIEDKFLIAFLIVLLFSPHYTAYLFIVANGSFYGLAYNWILGGVCQSDNTEVGASHEDAAL